MNAPLSTPRRGFLAVTGIAAAFVIGQGGLNLVAKYGSTTETTSSVMTPTGVQVRIGSDNGNVAVHPSSDAFIHITTRAEYGLRRPRLDQRADGSGIDLDGDCQWLDSQCRVDYDIAVPAGIDITVETGSGDVDIVDVAASARLSTGSGNIRVSRLRSSVLDLRTGSGDIDIRGTDGSVVTARTGSGNVSADFSRPPDDVQARTESGDVTLRLPAAAYAVDVDTGSGDTSIAVINDPASARKVLARTGSGNVEINPLAER